LTDLIDEGFYKGTIRNAYLSAFDDNEDELVMVFVVELIGDRAGGEEVTARHRCGGEYPDIAKNVAALLGLEWPHGLKEIASTIGQEVPIRIKHKSAGGGRVYVNAYIQAPRSGQKEISADTAKRLIDKLADEPGDEHIPF